MNLNKGQPLEATHYITKQNRVLKINSLMIAVVLCSNFIAITLAALRIVSEGFLPIIIISALVISWCTTVIRSPKCITIRKNSLLFILFIMMFFIITIGIRGYDSTVIEYFYEFMGYGFIVYLITLLPFHPYKVIQYTMFIGIIFLISPNEILNHIGLANSIYGRIDMGSSYAILPCIVAAIIHFAFFRKQKHFLNTIGYLTNLILLIILMTQASRGAVLAIFILICLIYYVKIVKKVRSNRHLLIMFMSNVIVIIGILIVINLKELLLWSYQFLQGLGIEVAAILKTYTMVVNEDNILGLLNGRDYFYLKSFELFLQSPIWGHGIGIFGDNYGSYPHNLFLQLLNEGGVMLMFPVGAVLFGCIQLFLKPSSKDETVNEWRYLLILLFIVAVPRLIFSSYLWQQQSFWLMVFTYFLIKNLHKKNKYSLYSSRVS